MNPIMTTSQRKRIWTLQFDPKEFEGTLGCEDTILESSSFETKQCHLRPKRGVPLADTTNLGAMNNAKKPFKPVVPARPTSSNQTTSGADARNAAVPSRTFQNTSLHDAVLHPVGGRARPRWVEVRTFLPPRNPLGGTFLLLLERVLLWTISNRPGNVSYHLSQIDLDFS